MTTRHARQPSPNEINHNHGNPFVNDNVFLFDKRGERRTQSPPQSKFFSFETCKIIGTFYNKLHKLTFNCLKYFLLLAR